MDIQANTPSDSTPATLFAVAVALGAADPKTGAMISGARDASGNLWAIYIEPTPRPSQPGMWAHLRWLPADGVSPPPGVTIGGTQAAPTLAFETLPGVPAGAVALSLEDYQIFSWA